MKKVSAGAFAGFLRERLAAKDGYIMGATGQDPSKWDAGSWWFAQYSGDQRAKALYWRAHAARVWDCAGLAEGYYQDVTGVNVNTRARNIYAQWCGVKGTGAIPAEYRVPGAAVFMYSAGEGAITHVGYLSEPVEAGRNAGDWYVIEARGVMYGVVRTRLSARAWNRWGWMDRYFDYGTGEVLGTRALKKGCAGADVRALQEALIRLGFGCGACGADGEFGAATAAAVRAYQAARGLAADGIAGERTMAALRAEDEAAKEMAKETPGTLKVRPGTWHVRLGPGAEYASVGTVRGGERLAAARVDGWLPVRAGDGVRWVSQKAVEA